jgi:hypothetical protein
MIYTAVALKPGLVARKKSWFQIEQSIGDHRLTKETNILRICDKLLPLLLLRCPVICVCFARQKMYFVLFQTEQSIKRHILF